MSVEKNNVTHWIIRVGDGTNIRNAKYSVWGFKNGLAKSKFEDLIPGDVMWFLSNKNNNNLLVGVAEFSEIVNRKENPDHPKAISNKEQGWIGNDDWSILAWFENYHDIEHLKLSFKMKGQFNCIKYDSVKHHDETHDDLYKEYTGIIKYIKPTVFPDYIKFDESVNLEKLSLK